jgi:hypothetical protein
MGFVGQFSQVLDLQRQWKQDDLFEQDSQGGVVVTIAGVVEEHEEKLVGRKGSENVLFKISDVPSGKMFLELMRRMMGQRADLMDDEAERLYANTMGGEFDVLPRLEVLLSPYREVKIDTDPDLLDSREAGERTFDEEIC